MAGPRGENSVWCVGECSPSLIYTVQLMLETKNNPSGLQFFNSHQDNSVIFCFFYSNRGNIKANVSVDLSWLYNMNYSTCSKCLMTAAHPVLAVEGDCCFKLLLLLWFIWVFRTKACKIYTFSFFPHRFPQALTCYCHPKTCILEHY